MLETYFAASQTASCDQQYSWVISTFLLCLDAASSTFNTAQPILAFSLLLREEFHQVIIDRLLEEFADLTHWIRLSMTAVRCVDVDTLFHHFWGQIGWT